MGMDVDIGKKVDYGALEKALRAAAEKVGWKIEVEDEYKKGYALGSVKETKKYIYTDFNLRKGFLGRINMQVTVFSKDSSNSFYINPRSVSKEKIEEYLSAVSDNLKD